MPDMGQDWLNASRIEVDCPRRISKANINASCRLFPLVWPREHPVFYDPPVTPFYRLFPPLGIESADLARGMIEFKFQSGSKRCRRKSGGVASAASAATASSSPEIGRASCRERV